MIIYKITSKTTGKSYIGQTSKTPFQRFSMHVEDARAGLKTHFSRAILLYGRDDFVIETIEETTVEEVSKREIYWIKYYDTFNSGYNSTKGGEGGNTYAKKTEEEMKAIGKKISDSKIGGKNPNARAIKMKSIKTDEELFFESLSEAQNYFGESNHNKFSKRLNKLTKTIFNNEWMIAYEEDEYPKTAYIGVKNQRSIPATVTDTETGRELQFASLAAVDRFFGFGRDYTNKQRVKGNSFTHKERYKIKIG